MQRKDWAARVDGLVVFRGLLQSEPLASLRAALAADAAGLPGAVAAFERALFTPGTNWTDVLQDAVLEDVLDKYVREYIQPGDTINMSEKIVAISQGRAFPIEEIKVSRLAKILSHFVVKTNYGIGL